MTLAKYFFCSSVKVCLTSKVIGYIPAESKVGETGIFDVFKELDDDSDLYTPK